MLHLLYGPAASGKTDLLMGRIRTAVAARTPGQVLLVPEQYSHEAERALCAACGDSLSLYAEVLSFTGLARRVAAETLAQCTRARTARRVLTALSALASLGYLIAFALRWQVW